jgi:uncharacterized heparinase superfamily protein
VAREGRVLERLRWYQRRLRAMSAGEAAARSERALVELTDGVLFAAAPRLWRARWEPARERLLTTPPVRRPIGFMVPDRGPELRARFPDAAEALLERAERTLARRVKFFGYPEVTLNGIPDDVDPFTRRRWPNRHAKRIDYRRSEVGDPKWIWELHRCQDLSVLAAAWLADGDDRHGRAATERLLAWIRAHPPGRGMPWSSGFEAAMRAIALVLTVDALRGSTLLDDDDLESALVSLWQHGRWITRDPSTGSSANNHRIGELVGLVLIGSLAPELRAAPHWVSLGLEGLAREAALQIRPDGTSAEQAFSYHLFVADLLLLSVAVLDATGHSVPEEVTAAIVRSGDALWAQLGEHEPTPTYGDTDDGRAFVLDAAKLRDPRGVASCIAARFRHPAAKRMSEGLHPSALWLFGPEGAERFDQTDPAPAPGSVTLPNGGLTILRHARRRVIFDHGPHGYRALAAHGHADALRVDVSLAENELVVDPGVGSYFARPPFRSAFRGTGLHATVSVDERDSSESGGPFLWTRHARTRVLALDLERGFVVAEHDGYARLDDPVTHRRAVIALADGSLLVVDRLEAKGVHRYSQRWPLHPSLELEACSPERIVARRDGAGVLVGVSLREEASVTATRGQVEPPLGWWSERLESVVPSWLVSVDAEACGPFEIVTIVVPFDKEAPAETRVDTTVTGAGTLVEVQGTRGRPEIVHVDLHSTLVTVSRQAVRSDSGRGQS